MKQEIEPVPTLKRASSSQGPAGRRRPGGRPRCVHRGLYYTVLYYTVLYDTILYYAQIPALDRALSPRPGSPVAGRFGVLRLRRWPGSACGCSFADLSTILPPTFGAFAFVRGSRWFSVSRFRVGGCVWCGFRSARSCHVDRAKVRSQATEEAAAAADPGPRKARHGPRETPETVASPFGPLSGRGDAPRRAHALCGTASSRPGATGVAGARSVEAPSRRRCRVAHAALTLPRCPRLARRPPTLPGKPTPWASERERRAALCGEGEKKCSEDVQMMWCLTDALWTDTTD